MTSAARVGGAGASQSTLALLLEKKEKLEDELRSVEKQASSALQMFLLGPVGQH